MSRSTTYSRWCFTLNNYELHEEGDLRKSIETSCKYAIVGREVGEAGTPHLQGFVIFSKRCTLLTAKDRLNSRCHVEIANGSPGQNRTYCTKGGDYWEHGTVPEGGATPGRSTRDTVACEFVAAMGRGRTGLSEFADARPGAYYYSRSQLLRNFLGHQQAVHRPNIRVRWFYGPPGVGKSRHAHEELPDAYIKEPRTKWWNNYLLEKDVIIDDFGPSGIDINHLLRWFDRYKCYVEVKGDMVPLCAENFIVTSNFHPEKIFSFAGECNPQLPALMRRITITEFEYIRNSILDRRPIGPGKVLTATWPCSA